MKTKMLNLKVILRSFLIIVTLFLFQATAQTKIKEKQARHKVYVCHGGKLIFIDISYWPAHKSHGDNLGPCEEQPPVNAPQEHSK